MLTELIRQIILFLPKLAASLAIFLAFWLSSYLLKRLMRPLARNSQLNPDALKLIQQISSAVILIFGLITALGTLGIDISAIVAGLGLTGFAVGLALKDILSNLVAGSLILIYRPFRRGDRISVSNFEGTVTEIDLRYTTLKDKEKKILIPNSFLFTHTICIIGEAGVKIITK
ncbi:mechanosensitive ion channel [Oxynema aestuarii AP17]|uniref:Mechanosensitive ion channel n=1 Tax=Oxynema aestuarii AP17 TaxID=2064643 RepID=A0A6H1U643_9CYAN|nr:mechanosensitive ion channel [Oxynema aestuarii AP17]